MVFSYIFRHINSIYVRDEVSKEILQSVFNRNLSTYDSAFVYDRAYTANDRVKKYTHLLELLIIVCTVNTLMINRYHKSNILNLDCTFRRRS